MYVYARWTPAVRSVNNNDKKIKPVTVGAMIKKKNDDDDGGDETTTTTMNFVERVES